MLTKLSTLRITTKVHICQKITHGNSFQQVLYTQRSIYCFKKEKDQDTITIQKYINNEQNNLVSANNLKYKFQQFVVPRIQPNIDDLNKKLQIDWKHRKLVLNIDPSALIGSKRLYMKNKLQKNVYQGLSQPTSIFSQNNPSIEIATQEIRFDPEHFLYSDPLAKQMLNNTQHLQTQQQYEAIQQALSDLYEKQPQRFGNRLKKQLKVPESYHKIIEMGMYNGNQIFFCGLNQYSLRHLLVRCYTLQQLKQLFMLSLRYAQSQSLRSKTTQILALKGKFEQHYNDFARELIYLNNYKLIKKIQNGQIIRRIGFVTGYKHEEEQLDQQQQKQIKQAETVAPTRGRRATASKVNAKNKEGLVLLAHSYTIQTLNDYTMIKNLQQQLNKKQSNIFNRSINFPSEKQQARQSANSSQNDAEKIEKHAILEVMLGDLWNQPYTFNKFPYISQDYNRLNEEDKNHVKQIYYDHLVKYTGAKSLYYQKNINTIEKMSVAQLAAINVKDKYKQTRENYQKNLETIGKKQKKKQQVRQKKEKMEKTKNKVEDDMFKQYPGKYEQQPSVKEIKLQSQPQNQLSESVDKNIQEKTAKQQTKKAQQTIGRKRKQRPSKPSNQSKNP